MKSYGKSGLKLAPEGMMERIQKLEKIKDKSD